MQDAESSYPELNREDILFVKKIMAFADKFKVLHWAAVSNDYHVRIDEFGAILEDFKDDIAENIQATIGNFDPKDFTNLELPFGDDPLITINQLKDCCTYWIELHKDDVEYEGCRDLYSSFFKDIKTYIYLFRLCK